MDLGALGAAASGFTRSVVRGEDRNTARARQRTLDDRNEVLWDRQQEQFGREDADRKMMEEANAAGTEVIKRYQTQWQKEQPGPTLDGSPVPANPFKPTPTQILEAGRARTNKLLQLKGPNEAWLNAWTNDEKMGGQVRAQIGQKVKAALAAGADLTEPISEFFGTINDGYQVRGVKRTMGPDGRAVLAIDRVNAFTGQPAEPMLVPADRLAQDIDMLSANQADLAKHSLQMNLKAYEALMDRGTAEAKHKLTLGEIEARGEQERTTVRERERGERTRPYTLGDGAERFVDTPQPDGTIKPMRVAGNVKDKPGDRATTAKQLNDIVINNYGVLDVGTGKQTGSAKTQAIAAAAERLIVDNPGLGPNEAIIQAAKDLGITLTPKK